MTDELKPVRCGCGGEAEVVKHEFHGASPSYGVECTNCHAESWQFYNTEAEAIEAWNRAMSGSTEKSSTVERTAKVKDLDRRSETSMSWEGICTKCGAYTNHEMNYCFECGCRLIWGEDDE